MQFDFVPVRACLFEFPMLFACLYFSAGTGSVVNCQRELNLMMMFFELPALATGETVTDIDARVLVSNAAKESSGTFFLNKLTFGGSHSVMIFECLLLFSTFLSCA